MELGQAIAEVLRKHPVVQLAVLYGSLARGEERAESDLDLAVMGDRTLTADEHIGLISDLAIRFGRPVDLVDMRTAQGTLLTEIFQTGRRVVEHDTTLYPTRLSRHLIDEADFGPIRDRILAERRHAWLST